MVFVYYRGDDPHADAEVARLLQEGGQRVSLGQNWFVRQERSHHDPNTYHTHFLYGRNQISVINIDGSPSHGTTRAGLPNWVVDAAIEKGYINEGAGLPIVTAEPYLLEKVQHIQRFGLTSLIFIQTCVSVANRLWGRR